MKKEIKEANKTESRNFILKIKHLFLGIYGDIYNPCCSGETPNSPVADVFERSWKNARIDPPKEGGRYWCLVEEQNDLGKSYFQWNCNYHEVEKRWSDDFKNMNVIYWTELAPIPFLYL